MKKIAKKTAALLIAVGVLFSEAIITPAAELSDEVHLDSEEQIENAETEIRQYAETLQDETDTANQIEHAPDDEKATPETTAQEEVIDADFTGFVMIKGEYWYAEDGKVMTSYTGIVKAPTAQSSPYENRTWWYVSEGRLDESACGMVHKADGSSNTWYYVENGKYSKSTGLTRKADGSSNTWYYVENGKYVAGSGLTRKADGSSKTWYYVENGKYSTSTGLAQKADGSSKTWYYVENGKYSTNTGLAQKADGSSKTWYFVSKGAYCKTGSGYTQKLTKNGEPAYFYYYESGRLTARTGLYKGKINEISGYWYNKSGRVDLTLNGLVKANYSNRTSYWYLKDGKLDLSFTGLCSCNGNVWYVKKGECSKKLSGQFTDSSGRKWTYKNNKAALVSTTSKNIVFFGDSFVRGAGASDYAGNAFVSMIAESTGYKLFNYAISGSGVVASKSTRPNTELWQQYLMATGEGTAASSSLFKTKKAMTESQRENTEYVVIALGINDTASMLVSSPNSAPKYDGSDILTWIKTVYWSEFRKTIEACRSAFPSATIIIAFGNQSAYDRDASKRVIDIDTYTQVIDAVNSLISKEGPDVVLAENYGYVLDRSSGTTDYAYDLLHPCDNGHTKFAQWFTNIIFQN